MDTHAELKKRFIHGIIDHINRKLKSSFRRPFDENDIVFILQLIDNDVDETVSAYMESGEMENLTDWFDFDECDLVLFVNNKKIQLFKGYTKKDFDNVKARFRDQITADLTIGINDLDDETNVKPYSQSQIRDVLDRFDEHISDTVRRYLEKANDPTTNEWITEWCIVEVERSPLKLVLDDNVYDI